MRLGDRAVPGAVPQRVRPGPARGNHPVPGAGTARDAGRWDAERRSPADARHVAVETDVSLDPADTGHGDDLYVIDLQTGAKTWASRPLAGGAQGDSDCPSLSADGRLVAFVGEHP